ncbi:MAG: hypothetical protein HY868_01895 [Chloroflexi bacterium]|nr:hypothetical protein [Chloroflexota bacterium]
MIDIHEFLGRGIIAARAGNTADALRYLNIAARFYPKNARAWLWLAAVCDAPDQRRDCLRKVLELDPASLPAKILLERASRVDLASPSALAQAYAFQCPTCAGQQRFDPDCASLTCTDCGRVEQLAAPNAADTEQDLGTALRQSASGNWALVSGQLVCEACGATILLPANQSSTICPFCASARVLVRPPTPDLVLPHAIIPFAFENDKARQHIHRWLAGGWFMADDLVRLARSRELRGVYLPFWTFDGQTQIRCLVHYRVEPTTYSATERLVNYGDSLSRQLWYEKDFDDVLVYAGRSAVLKSLQALLPFDLKQVVEYEPGFLAGWQAEVYQLSLADAAQQAYKQMRDQAIQSFDLHGVVQDYSNFLNDDIVVAQRTFKLILLPVWVGTYDYQGKRYQVLVNGQTGNVSGEKPLNWSKVILAEIGAILALGLLILLAILIWYTRG